MNSSSDEDSDKESSDGLQELVDKVDKQNNAIVQNLATPVHGGGARHVNYVPSMAAWRRGQLVNNSPFPLFSHFQISLNNSHFIAGRC